MATEERGDQPFENNVVINGKSYSTSKVFGKESGDKKDYYQSDFAIEEDLDYQEVENLTGSELPQKVFLCLELSGNFFKDTHASFIDLARNNNTLFMSFDVSYSLSNWGESINVLSFIEILRKRILDKYAIQSVQENFFEEDLISVKFRIESKSSAKIKKIVKSFHKKLSNVRSLIIDHYSSYGKIIKNTYIPDSHKGAAISLMHYFSEFSRAKEPEVDLSVSITSDNNNITMELSFPNEHRNEVDSLIQDYGLILNESKLPSETLTNPSDILLLNCELKMAQARIQMQEEIIASGNDHIKDLRGDITGLKKDIKWLQKQVSNSFLSKDKYLDKFIAMLDTKGNRISISSRELIEGIKKGDDNLIATSSEKIKESDPEGSKYIKSFISNLISSAGANAPAWAVFLSKAF